MLGLEDSLEYVGVGFLLYNMCLTLLIYSSNVYKNNELRTKHSYLKDLMTHSYIDGWFAFWILSK
jgi:methionine salvage enolase-phosphatase E1